MKRGLIFSLALVMIMAALMPSQVLAAKPVPFDATGNVFYITPGTVKPAGTSGRFVVIERDIVGSIGGAISGPYTFSYKANVELLTQAGNLHGTLTVGERDYVLNISGKTLPLELTDDQSNCPPEYCPSGDYQVFRSTIDGHWDFLVGAHGEGNFNANVLLVIDMSTNHVVWVNGGSVTLTGQWQE